VPHRRGLLMSSGKAPNSGRWRRSAGGQQDSLARSRLQYVPFAGLCVPVGYRPGVLGEIELAPLGEGERCEAAARSRSQISRRTEGAMDPLLHRCVARGWHAARGKSLISMTRGGIPQPFMSLVYKGSSGLAKVGVASSSLVSRSIHFQGRPEVYRRSRRLLNLGW
jgi:hypothetical protein